jgi:hypothetical protein
MRISRGLIRISSVRERTRASGWFKLADINEKDIYYCQLTYIAGNEMLVNDVCIRICRKSLIDSFVIEV